MKFELKGHFRENIYNLMRKIGYYYQNQQKEELSFVRPPKGFPRFHLFLKIEKENLIFNLHLDQKAPIYKGVKAHAGEYESEVVKKEVERIKKTLENLKV